MDAFSENDYFPSVEGETEWKKIEPSAAGFDPAALDEAVSFAITNETRWPHDLEKAMENKESGVDSAALKYSTVFAPGNFPWSGRRN